MHFQILLSYIIFILNDKMLFGFLCVDFHFHNTIVLTLPDILTALFSFLKQYGITLNYLYLQV